MVHKSCRDTSPRLEFLVFRLWVLPVRFHIRFYVRLPVCLLFWSMVICLSARLIFGCLPVCLQVRLGFRCLEVLLHVDFLGRFPMSLTAFFRTGFVASFRFKWFPAFYTYLNHGYPASVHLSRLTTLCRLFTIFWFMSMFREGALGWTPSLISRVPLHFGYFEHP